MSDLICRKTMMRCQTPGMCSPYGGCTPQPVAESVFKADYAALIEQAKSAPAEPDVERPISIPTALILWAGIEDQSQPTQWHKGYEAARGYVNMQICSAIPTTKDHLAVAEPVSREAVGLIVERDIMGTMHIKMPAHDGGEPFDFVQVQYRYPYTDNRGTQKLAEKIAELISGKSLTAPPSPDAELVELLREARELIEHGDFREGHCMCGSAVEAHGFGDGHSPVDAGVYYAGQVMERIDAKLASLKGVEE